MFELTDTKARLTSFNPRAEMHGKDEKTAGDLKFSASLAAEDVLPYFDPALRSLLYCKKDGVQAGDMADQAHDAPNIRFPQLKVPLDWEMELVGASLVIDHGLGGRSDLTLDGVKVNAFKLEPKEGGTVLVSFRVQTSEELDAKTAGALCLLIQKELTITLTPPAADELPLANAA